MNFLRKPAVLFYGIWIIFSVISLITCFLVYPIETILNDLSLLDIWFIFFVLSCWGILTIFILPYYIFPDLKMYYSENYSLFLKIFTLAFYPIFIFILSCILPEEYKSFFHYVAYIALIGVALLPITVSITCIENNSNPILINSFLIGGFLVVYFLLWLFTFISLLFILLILLVILILLLYSIFLPVYTIFTMVSDKNFFDFLGEILPDYDEHAEISISTPSKSAYDKEKEAAKEAERYEREHHYYHYKTTVDNTLSHEYSSPIANARCVDVSYTVTFHYKTSSGRTTTKKQYGELTARHLPNAALTAREAEEMYSYLKEDFYDGRLL